MRRQDVNNMPESSRGADADTAVRERQQREPGGPPSQNVVSAISQFADDNLTLVRVGASPELRLTADAR